MFRRRKVHAVNKYHVVKIGISNDAEWENSRFITEIQPVAQILHSYDCLSWFKMPLKLVYILITLKLSSIALKQQCSASERSDTNIVTDYAKKSFN